MPLSAICRHCGSPKPESDYWNLFCADCQSAIDQSKEYARQNNLDPGVTRREALAQRAHGVHANQINPKTPISRHIFWNPRDARNS